MIGNVVEVTGKFSVFICDHAKGTVERETNDRSISLYKEIYKGPAFLVYFANKKDVRTYFGTRYEDEERPMTAWIPIHFCSSITQAKLE